MPSWELDALRFSAAAGFTPCQTELYVHLARQAKPHQEVLFKGSRQLAEELGRDRRNVQRDLRRIEAAGVPVDHHRGRLLGSVKGRIRGNANGFRRPTNGVETDAVTKGVQTDAVSSQLKASKRTPLNPVLNSTNGVQTDAPYTGDMALRAHISPSRLREQDAADSLRSAAPITTSFSPAAVSAAALTAETPERGWVVEQTLGDLARTHSDFVSDWHKARTPGSASHAPRKGAVAHLLETPLSRPAPELELPDPRTRRRHP